jgi:hypothetical protein
MLGQTMGDRPWTIDHSRQGDEAAQRLVGRRAEARIRRIADRPGGARYADCDEIYALISS